MTDGGDGRRLTSDDIVGDRLDLLSDHYINSNMYREEDVAAVVSGLIDDIREAARDAEEHGWGRMVAAYEGDIRRIKKLFPAVTDSDEPDGESGTTHKGEVRQQ